MKVHFQAPLGGHGGDSGHVSSRSPLHISRFLSREGLGSCPPCPPCPPSCRDHLPTIRAGTDALCTFKVEIPYDTPGDTSEGIPETAAVELVRGTAGEFCEGALEVPVLLRSLDRLGG